MKKEELPDKIPVFPLTNFIIFPGSDVPLNIFEPKYIQMVDESMSGNRLIGIIQPKKSGELNKPDLHKIGCIGKITSFNETGDGRYIINLKGICRFKTIEEIENKKIFREYQIRYDEYVDDLSNKIEEIKFADLNTIFKNLKSLFKKQGYVINWKEIEKQNLVQTINTLAMASPFSMEEKQILLETINLKNRKEKLEEILKIYNLDNFSNTTLQ
tara:strand:- start:180 stop:821 length:642 start_codon:yes stop_codon:yes gene_type:complete